MASRKRKTTESLNSYRANLKTEQDAINLKLKGKMNFISVSYVFDKIKQTVISKTTDTYRRPIRRTAQ